MLDIDDLRGLWRRSLFALPDGFRDTTTQVYWLQGLSLYVDLRQNDLRPCFEGVDCLRDLTAGQIAWLCEQDGFAGTLRRIGDYFEWTRALDFRPPSSNADVGRLWLEDGMMKEEGRDVPYIEHWHREPTLSTPMAGFTLRDEASGILGSLVVAGEQFMYARGRAMALPAGTRLSALVETAESLEEAQDMIDCEISVGTIAGDYWTVRRSTLPFKEGRPFVLLRASRETGRLQTEDIDDTGRPLRRNWQILESEGDIDLLEPVTELYSISR